MFEMLAKSFVATYIFGGNHIKYLLSRQAKDAYVCYWIRSLVLNYVDIIAPRNYLTESIVIDQYFDIFLWLSHPVGMKTDLSI